MGSRSDEDGKVTRVSGKMPRNRASSPISSKPSAAPRLADDDHDNEDPDIPRNRPSNEPLPENERAFGRYTLLRRLAYGGMGEIFLARQGGRGQLSSIAKLVVIKRILSHMRRDEKHRRMFLDEARLQALLSNPHIVQIHDMGEENGHVYLAMEHVHGPSLRAVIDRAQKLREQIPVAYVVDMVAQAARGLSYAHNLVDVTGQPLRIVHRDINPQNILVTYDGEVKIIDFGIAKSELGSGHTETGTIKGKFQYMSPEQSAAEKLDKRSDLFTLGICLYELLTLENPFRRQNVVLSLEAIQKENVPPIERRRPDARVLAPIVERALAKDVEHRFVDGAELADQLEQIARSGVLPPPPAPLAVWLRERFTAEIAEHLHILEATGSQGAAVVRSPSDPNAFPKARPTSVVDGHMVLEEHTDPSIEQVADGEALVDPGASNMDAHAEPIAGDEHDDPTATASYVQPSPAQPLPTDLTSTTPAPARLPAQEEPPRRSLLWAALSFVVVAGIACSIVLGAVWLRPSLAKKLPRPVGDRLAFLARDEEPVAPPIVEKPPVVPVVIEKPPVAVDPPPEEKPPEEKPPEEKPPEEKPPEEKPPEEPVVDEKPAAKEPRERTARPRQKSEPKVEEPKEIAGTLLVTTEGFQVKGGRKLPKGGSTTLKIGGDGAPYAVTLKVTDADGKAKVVVATEPWAILTVDSVGKGKTPQTFELAPGKRATLSLKNPTAGPTELSIQLAAP